ncbi:MAG: STAS domain-containing protein, partial [Methyloceanibacter sp.]
MGEVLLTSQLKGERLELAASGSWTAAHAGELETLVDGAASQAAAAKNVSIDMGGVREFDTFGAWLLERLTRAWSSAGAELEIVGMPAHDRN